jgi:hypothetical protein
MLAVTMSRRSVFWVAVFLGLLLLGSAAIAALMHVPEDGITKENAERVKVGMSVDKVKSLLRKEPGVGIPCLADYSFSWTGAEGTIWVGFTRADNKVYAPAEFIPRQPRSFLDRIYEWFGW